MNDILIYSKILKEHKTHVKEVLNKLHEVNLQINIDKYKFKIQKILFLKLLIFINDLQMNSWKVDVIQSWKVSWLLTYVQIFIDFCNFYLLRAYQDWLELVNDLVEIWPKSGSGLTQIWLNTLFLSQHLVHLHHLLFMLQTHFFWV